MSSKAYFHLTGLTAEESAAFHADHQLRLNTCLIMICDQQRVLLILSAAKFYPFSPGCAQIKLNALVVVRHAPIGTLESVGHCLIITGAPYFIVVISGG